MTRSGIGLDDWLLTESVRDREERTGRWPNDGSAIRLAVQADQAFATRLAVRARALPGLGAVSDDLARLRRAAYRFALALFALGLLAGWLAARLATREREIDLLLAGLTLLGLPVLMLLIWLLVMLFLPQRSARGLPMGGLVERALNLIGPRLLASELAVELTRSAGSTLTTRFGRWLLSLMSHAFWLGYALAALLALALYFSIAQFNLVWGTTILSEAQVISLIQALAWLPDQLGLMPPSFDVDLVARGRLGDGGAQDRAVWAHYLMLLVALYAALPRLALVVLSRVMLGRRARAMPLDTGRAGYLRLRAELMPESSTARTLGAAPEKMPDKPLRQAGAKSRGCVLIGYELGGAEDSELAALLGPSVVTLGTIQSRSDRDALKDALASLEPPPVVLLTVCSALRTPDAGTARALDQLADAARSALLLVLLDQAALAARGGDQSARRQDWQTLARQVGGRIIEAELEESGARSVQDRIDEIAGAAA